MPALLVVATFIALLGFHGELLMVPNQKAVSISGDAIKNYFTTTWHAKHDSSLSRFEGMNYPIGEQVTFPDAQPALSGSLQLLRKAGLDFTDYTVGIMHYAMLLSALLAVLASFLLLRWYQVDHWAAAILAVGILWLCPQWERFGGHFSLMYIHAIPVSWYLLERFRHSLHWKWVILHFLHIAVLLGLHLYYFFIIGVFMAGYLLFYTLVHLKQKSTKRLWVFSLGNILSIILPLLLFQIWMSATDIGETRIDTPYGLKIYRSNLIAITYPMYAARSEALAGLPIPTNWNWEGYGYAGVAVLLTAIGGFVSYGTRIVVARIRKVKRTLSARQQEYIVLVGTALFALMISSALPFRLLPNELLEWLGPIKQFRSMGRATWVYYFVLSTFISVWVYRNFWQSTVLWRKGLAVGFVLVFLAEGVVYQNTLLNNMIFDNPLAPNSTYRTAAKNAGVCFKDYQALLPAPYILYGSERGAFMPAKDGGSLANNVPLYAMQIETGLPATHMESARATLESYLANAAFSFRPFQEATPKRVAQLPSEKPLLVLSKPELPTYTYHRWLHVAGSVVDTFASGYKLRKLELDTWQHWGRQWKLDQQAQANALQAHRIHSSHFFSKDSSLADYPMFYENYEQTETYPTSDKNPYNGARSVYLEEAQQHIFAQPIAVPENKWYRLRAWIYAPPAALAKQALGLEVIQLNAKKERITHWPHVVQHVVAFDGNWALLELEFEMMASTVEFAVHLGSWFTPVSVDDLLLEPLEVHHIDTTDAGQARLDLQVISDD